MGLTARTVETVPRLHLQGWTISAVRAQLAAHRWQRFGRAVLLHNGPPTEGERRAIALINCGAHALLTSFTGAGVLGLTGWHRDVTHALVLGGTRVHRVAGAPVRVH